MATCTLPASACPCIDSLARSGGISIVMTAPMVDYKIHWLKMMSVPESRAVVGRHDGINGRDRVRTGLLERWQCGFFSDTRWICCERMGSRTIPQTGKAGRRQPKGACSYLFAPRWRQTCGAFHFRSRLLRPYCVRSRRPACRFRTLRPFTPDALVGAGEAETRMVSAGGCREAAARGSRVPAVSARPERSCARSR